MAEFWESAPLVGQPSNAPAAGNFWESAPLVAAPPKAQEKAPQRNEAIDSANAVGTGYFRGLTRLAGLPVDTAANVVDLGKAALGAPYIALTGNAPPSWLEVGDRSGVVGSGENLLRGVRAIGGGAAVDPANPAYEGGYLQAAGGAANGVMRPNSLAQLVNQAGLSEAGALGSKAVGDSTGNNALAITAGMLPLGAQTAATAGVKRLVRGGEEGRVAMAQRVADLEAAGVSNPTLGLASGNQLIGGVETLLQSTPGAVGRMRSAREGAVSGMQAKALEAANAADANRGPLRAGQAIQGGIDEFLANSRNTQQGLYGSLDSLIAPSTPASVGNTRNSLYGLTQVDPGAPALSRGFVNGRISSIRGDFDQDTGLVVPNASMSTTTPLIRAVEQAPIQRTTTQRWTPRNEQPAPLPGGGPRQPAPTSEGGNVSRTIQIPQAPVDTVVSTTSRTVNPRVSVRGEGPWRPPQDPTLPYGTLSNLRSQVGEELANKSLVPDAPLGQWKNLYGGISEDIRGAAAKQGPEATQAFNRANDFTRSMSNRLDTLKPFADKAAPEQAFISFVNAAKENGSVLQSVKKSLPEGARATVAGTVVERLGKANPGNQNDVGDVFSPERFLTNWNSMSMQGRRDLLSGFKNSDQVRGDVEALAKAASMMRDNSKLWANPSGTATNAAARGFLGAVGVGGLGAVSGMLNPLVPIGAATGLGGINLLSRAVTSPDVRAAMTRRTDIDPQLLNSLFLSLGADGQLGQ